MQVTTDKQTSNRALAPVSNMLEPTTEEFRQSVCEVMGTSLQQVRRDVAALKTWIASQPHLPQCSSDELLTSFLIACKNRMERAKQKIDNYYTARLEMPAFFQNRDPLQERVQEVAQELRLFTLPGLTPDGCRVTMSSFVTGDPQLYDIPAYITRFLAAEDLKYDRDPFVKGFYFVYDAKLFSLNHVFRLTPQLARQMMRCMQDVIPIIIKGVIFINAPAYVEMAINIVKPFVKTKIMKRFHVHQGGPEELERYFPKAMLPADYGGEEDTSDKLNEAWLKLLVDNRKWLMNEGSLTVDEGKRPKDKKLSEKGIGMQEVQGSFRTLCID